MTNIDSKTKLDILNEVLVNLSNMYRKHCSEETEAKFKFLDAQRILDSDEGKESLSYREYMILSDKKEYFEMVYKNKQYKSYGISMAREVILDMIGKEYERMDIEEVEGTF